MPQKKVDKLQKKALAKETKKAKQQKKANLKYSKAAKQSGHQAEEEDIYEILAGFDKEEALKCGRGCQTEELVSSVKLVPCCQPPPRAACSLTQLPGGELLLFGGEFYNGTSVQVFNETFRWNIEKNEWRQVTQTGRCPKPRCSHQAALYKDYVYMFGGEFSTLTQFYHFRDLWRFNARSNTWSEVECSGTPPIARSGHRMVVFKSYLVLFGGFVDTCRDTRYLNDLAILSLQTLQWIKITNSFTNAPSPRSGVLMAPFPQNDGILLSGGYCKVKDTEKGAQGVSIQDAWWLDMAKVISQTRNGCLPPGVEIWSKLGRKAALPSLRAGASIVTHKSMAVVFGGAFDSDPGGCTMQSVFYNDMYGLDLQRKRWYPLRLREPNVSGGRKDRSGPSLSAVDSQARPHLQLRSAPSSLSAHCSDSTTQSPTADKDNDDDICYFDSDDDDATFGYIDENGKLIRVRVENLASDNETPSPSGNPSQIGNKTPDINSVHSQLALKYSLVEEVLNQSQETEKVLTMDILRSAPDDPVCATDSLPQVSPIQSRLDDFEAVPELVEAKAFRSIAVSGAAHISEIFPADGDCRVSAEPLDSLHHSQPPSSTSRQLTANDAGDNSTLKCQVTTRSTPKLSNVPKILNANMPLPRLNASVLMRGNELLIYGGVIEIGKREFTLDDCWTINLNTRVQWNCILKGHLDAHPWDDSSDDDDDNTDNSSRHSSEYSDSTASESSTDSCTEEQLNTRAPINRISTSRKTPTTNFIRLRDEITSLKEQLLVKSIDERFPIPYPKESLREFFDRSKQLWLGIASSSSAQLDKRIDQKEVRRQAFDLASNQFSVLQPILEQLAYLENHDNKHNKNS